MQKLKKVNWHRVSWIIAIELAVAMVIIAFFFGGGMDTVRYYQPFADGCLDCGFIPYFAQILMSPLILAPAGYVWPFWTVFSLTGLLLVAWKQKSTR